MMGMPDGYQEISEEEFELAVAAGLWIKFYAVAATCAENKGMPAVCAAFADQSVLEYKKRFSLTGGVVGEED